MGQDDWAAGMSQRDDEESNGEELSMPYQKRREQLCIDGEAFRAPLLQSSFRMESLEQLQNTRPLYLPVSVGFEEWGI